MKLRQKLAVVLASAMVVTAVPVVTMAASTNSLTKETIHLAKDEITTSNAVKVEFKDSKQGQKEVFYLELQNAEWDFSTLAANDGTVNGNVVTFTNGTVYEKQSDTIVKVTYTVDATKEAQFPIMAEVTGGDATVSILTKGGNTTVSNGTFVFATTSDANVVVTAETKDLPTLYTEGTIADIMLTESMKGAFASLEDDEREVELTLENGDFEFVSAGTVEFTYGFAGQGNDTASVVAKVNSKDKQTIVVTLPQNLKSDSIGQIKLKGIKVKSTTKNPEAGELTISVDGDAVKDATDLKVAKITAYGSEIEVDKDDVVEIKAGEQKEVIFTLKEAEKGSFVNGRDVEFVIDKGFFMNQVEDKDGEFDEDATIEAMQKAVKIKNTENGKALTITDVTVNDDDKVVGFTATMVATDAKDEIEVKANITAGLEEEGEVTLTASGRALEKEVSGVITSIKKVFSVNTDAAVLKVGLQGQKAGKITLTEAEKGMFKAGSKVEITVPVANGITVKDIPTVTVTSGDIQMDKAVLGKVNKDDNTVKITIPVKRTSKTASTIEISGIEFTTDRTAAEGSYDVTLGGSAISATETLELENFLVIGTPNTEDLGANGLAKGTSTFVIGENKYTVNGVEKEMDARSYVQDPGYTMVPMRYVAEAFGVKGNNVLFSNGVTTIFAGNRTIQLTNNSDVAVVNGVQIKMATKVVIKDGRTYAPIGEVAQLLGVSKAWDNATKTATFTN